MRHSIWLLTALILVLLSWGCPRRLDPRAAPTVTSKDKHVSAAFAHAQRQFEHGAVNDADQTFAEILKQFPRDPLSDAARLYRGRIALSAGAPQRAYVLLQPLNRPSADPALREQATYYLGLSAIRTGRNEQGLRLLHALLGKIAPDAAPGLLAAIAFAERKLGRTRDATRHLQQLFATTDRPAERAHAKRQIGEIIDGFAEAELRSIFATTHADSLVHGLAAQRLIDLARQRGDTRQALEIERNTIGVRRHYRIGGQSNPHDPGGWRQALGVLLPLSGRFARLGRLALSAASFASGNLQSFSERSKPVVVYFRDSTRNASAAARSLIEDEHVVALVGVFDPHRVPDVALVAQQHGVPFLCLAPEAAMSAPQASTLQIAPGNAERAQELAAYALMQRRRPRAAILAPESAFGRAMSGSFGRALQRAGGSIVSTVTYAPNARTFSEVAKRLAKLDFDTLFVPDSAPTLALVAPALASVGLWSAPSGPSNGGRTILLLSTADGLNARVLADASRYLQQAVLAPGFYPASDGGSVTTLALAYHSALGHWPNLIEAMAFDAIIVLRHHLSAGTTQPSTLLTALHTTSVAGLTGDIQFGGNRKRAIPPPLYEVRGTEVMSLHVR